jgi:hypothetical protein
MVSIELAPSQLDAATKLLAEDDNGKIDYADGSTTAGHVHTSQIDADFEYRKRSETEGTLVFTNEVKHGLYKFVSDAIIGQHLTALLAKLTPPAAPEEAVPGTPLDASAENNAPVNSEPLAQA